MHRTPKKYFFLEWLRPLYEFWANRKKMFVRQLRAVFDDPYLSGMVAHFNIFHEWIFRPYFNKVRLNSEEIIHLKELSAQGTLVYIMKKRGQLEYSYFNRLFLKEGIPLARFSNGGYTLLWRPFREMFQSLLGRIDRYYQQGRLQNPIESGYLTRLIAQGESALINLKVSREFILGANPIRASEDPLAFIAPLLEGARQSKKPVYLITQQFLYDRHPEKSEKSWMDLLFGEKSNPGLFRKLILFIMSYSQRATVKFGEPLDLKQFLDSGSTTSTKDSFLQASELKKILLSRLMIERKSITGPVLKPQESFLEKILLDPYFQKKLETFRLEANLPLPELQQKTRRYFYEMAAQINYSYIDFYDRLIHWLVNNIYNGLDIDTEGLNAIKAVAGKYPVVLVPSHKSHIDYLLLSYIFYNFNLTLPHVCAGINLSFWPAGPLVRRGGGFFIRRTIVGNKLYKLVLESYLKALVTDGYSIEFFIEGTRSRTGKLLQPRMGILSMLFSAYLEKAAPDIYFVPISINYERILEQQSYVREIQGEGKEKENVAGILKAGKKLGHKYGRVSIQFAPPISLKTFLDEKGISSENKKENIFPEIKEFAHKITYNINKVAMVTSTSLVATACLTYPKKGIPEKEISRRAHLLKKYLDFKEARFSGVIRQNEQWAYREALQKLNNDRLIISQKDFSEKFYTLDEAQRTSLEFHKNNSIHFFVSLVCFSKIAALSSQASVLSLITIEKKYETLKTLLRHDFTFSERGTLREHLKKVISFYVGENIIHYDDNAEMIHLNGCEKNSTFIFYASLLDNFFESYWLTLLYIKHVSFSRLEAKKLVASILEKGRTVYAKGDLQYPEALSRFNIENALQVFSDLGLIKKEEKLMTRIYDAESIQRWEEILLSLLGRTTTVDSFAIDPTSPSLPESQTSHLQTH